MQQQTQTPQATQQASQQQQCQGKGATAPAVAANPHDPQATATASSQPTAEAAADGQDQDQGGTEIPPLEESCPADTKCGKADKPYHEGQGDQRRGNKHTKSQIRAEFRKQGVEKPPHLSWNEAAHMVGMTPFADEPQQGRGTPPQPASSSGEPPPDSKAAAEAKAKHEKNKAKFAQLLNLHHLPRQPPTATPHQAASSSSNEPAPESKADTAAKERHRSRMEALQTRDNPQHPGEARGQTAEHSDVTPAAASHQSQPQPLPTETAAAEGPGPHQRRGAVHIPTGGPLPRPFPLDSPITWNTAANHYMASMGGYLPPNPMPAALPITMHSYAHFRYLGHGGWVFCVLSRTSPATPSYQRVRRRGFARVRQQARHPHRGGLLSMGAQGEMHPLGGGGEPGMC